MRVVKITFLALAFAVAMASVVSGQRGVRSARRAMPQVSGAGARAGTGLGALVLRDSSLDRFSERLELTDEQRRQFQELADAYRNDNADALDRMDRMQEELRALRSGDERPTRQAVAEILRRYEHPDLDLAHSERRLVRNLGAILTAEQEIRLARGARLRVQTPPLRLRPGQVAPLRRMRGLAAPWRPAVRGRQPIGGGFSPMRRLPRRPAFP